MKRNVLLNPGPATTTDTVKMAQVVPDICPREAAFSDVMKEVCQGLVRIVHGSPAVYTAVLFCGSGTLAMDVCVNSLLPDKGKILVVNNGAYSSRAVAICEAYRLDYIDLRLPVNEQPDLDKVCQVLEQNPDVAVVYTTHHETGTGVLNPIREMGELAHRHGAIFVVDTTSSYAMLPIDVEKESIDFCMASAQKGIQAMTGLSFVIGRTALLDSLKGRSRRSYYCDLYAQYAYFQLHGQMQFTPPVQAVYAARQALKEYFSEGELDKWERHQRVIDEIHKGLAVLGFREVIRREIQAGLVVSVLYPKNAAWSFEFVHDFCYARGFTIYPGKMQAMGTFRLCALGAIDVQDIRDFFVVLQEALVISGVTVPVRYDDRE